MKTFRALGAFVLFVGFTVTAQAQATRTWVSGVGDDANPCSRTAPCKTFAGAISKTASGGEISVLDPGGFGAVTITKSITINGEGTLAGILSTGVPGIIINGSGIIVTLIDLKINGGTTGTDGVRILNAAAVNIEGCHIYDYQTASSIGVNIEPNIGVGVTTKVRIGDTKIYNNGFFGVESHPSGGGKVLLTLDHVAIFNTGASAVDVRNDTKATIRQCILTENGGAGVAADLGTADVNIYNTVMSNNSIGILSGNGGNPVIRIFGCQITDNTTNGVFLNGGTVLTHQNNAIQNNVGMQATSGNLGQQ